jgi:hypothetical protein
MPTAKVLFTHLIQDSQEYGSDGEHMVSRAFFDLDIDGTAHSGLYCDIKQAVGSSFESGPLDVSTPVGYSGPFNHQAFSEIAERYYRSLVGGAGHGIRISGGSNIRMTNNRFNAPMQAEFAVDATGGGW